ncbi:MAG: bifunctional aspartate kinase/homoserine dehydrogenase II [Kangiellaceae bacterium]|jgi:aspartokinase/homoserine dehydrogenase 2|nr:bifunctional aspartate kinase/homoserine dehydrogenase II [Kangiellaceae bacterium]
MSNVISIDQSLSLNYIQKPTDIYKFGGSSLANAQCFKTVAKIIKNDLSSNDWVVVSASYKTTDWLWSLITNDDVDEYNVLEKIYFHHKTIIDDCLQDDRARRLIDLLSRDIQQIKNLIKSSLVSKFQNSIIAFGECWSAQILCALLESQGQPASWIDARKFLVVHEFSEYNVIDEARSKIYLDELLKSRIGRLSIITGYIAKNTEGESLTLGRNGSDYTASILAKFTTNQQRKSANVTLWTDVSGIYDFDPNIDSSASVLDAIDFAKLNRLASVGSPIIHCRTLDPIKNLNSKLTIRSTFSVSNNGTRISNTNRNNNHILSHRNNLVVLHLAINNEVDAKRIQLSIESVAQEKWLTLGLFIKDNSQNYQLIVEQQLKNQWLDVLEQWQVEVTDDFTGSTLALVGNSQLPTDYQLDFVKRWLSLNLDIDSEAVIRTLDYQGIILSVIPLEHIDDIASRLYRSWRNYCHKTAIFLLGVGNVGKTWLEKFYPLLNCCDSSSIHQVNDTNPRVTSYTESLFDPELVLTANSKSLTLLNGQTFKTINNSNAVLESIIKSSPFENKVVIDATASNDISDLYLSLFNHGVHVISANKIASSASQAVFNQLVTTAHKNRIKWQQNATIGAGLPINHTISDLVNCGDSIQSIRGVFSGTLSWLLQNYDGTQPLSKLIRLAQQQGLSEPDPRIDLSGLDVARKLVVAARLAKLELNISDIARSALISKDYLASSQEQFWQDSAQFDQEFHKLWLKANGQNKRLVYQAHIDQSLHAECRLIALDCHDPLTQIQPSDNIFEVKTKWYNDNPLIIRGPGAGREVTAAAVQSDLLAILNQI